jgi:hypothetical protein
MYVPKEMKFPKEVILLEDKLKFLENLFSDDDNEGNDLILRCIIHLCIIEISDSFHVVDDKEYYHTIIIIKNVLESYDTLAKDSKWLEIGGFKKFCLQSTLNRNGLMTRLFNLVMESI